MTPPTLTPITASDAERLCGTGTGTARFLQSPFWAAFKGRHGWTPLYFSVSESSPANKPPACGHSVVVLVRRVAAFHLAYVPLYPEIPPLGETAFPADSVGELLVAVTTALQPHLPPQTLCVRYDLTPVFSTTSDAALWKHRLCRHRGLRDAAAVQPPDTVVLNLSLTEEELLERMKSKWRYNIRLAEKKGVTIRRADAAGIDCFYQLYQVTAKRDGIAIHSRDYYASLFDTAATALPTADVRLYIAEHEGDALAAIITLFCAREGVYLYGAASNEKRNLMATYLLQWQAIRDAKAAGSRLYDFYGISPTDDESHPMHGLYRFKTGFGGVIVHRAGCVDAVLSPAYMLYRAAETLRAFWYKRVKKWLSRRQTVLAATMVLPLLLSACLTLDAAPPPRRSPVAVVNAVVIPAPSSVSAAANADDADAVLDDATADAMIDDADAVDVAESAEAPDIDAIQQALIAADNDAALVAVSEPLPPPAIPDVMLAEEPPDAVIETPVVAEMIASAVDERAAPAPAGDTAVGAPVPETAPPVAAVSTPAAAAVAKTPAPKIAPAVAVASAPTVAPAPATVPAPAADAAAGTPVPESTEDAEPAEPVIVPAEDTTPSRTVTLRQGQWLDVRYPGTGWNYLGEDGDTNLLAYGTRDIRAAETVFSLRATTPGTAVLHFFKADQLRNVPINDYLAVSITADGGDSVSSPIGSVVPSRVEAPAYSTPPPPATAVPQTLRPAQGGSAAVADTAPANATGTTATVAAGDAVPHSVAAPRYRTEAELAAVLQQATDAAASADYETAMRLIETYLAETAANLDRGLYLKGQVYEAKSPARNLKTALDAYRTLADQFPDSPLRARAEERATYLQRFFFDIR